MSVAATSAIFGYCGLIYEFVLAQSLSILFGHSVVQYSVTIGLFIAAMGLGSHLAENFHDPRLALWRTQLCLSLLAPAACVFFWWLAVSGHLIAARVVAYSAIVGIGFLTGTELPLLLRLRAGPSLGAVLGADYLGMLAACVLFPLWLLPEIGVLKTLFATALLNSAMMACLWPRRISLAIPIAGVLALLIYFEPLIREAMSTKLVGG